MEQPHQTTFPLFPCLPAELRLHIWRLSFTPRVVTLTYRPLPVDQCFSPTPLPIVLSVCHESRSEALRFYKKTFATRSHPHGEIYFHAALDALYVPRTGLMGYSDAARDFGSAILTSGAEVVQKVAVDYVNPEIRRPWEVYSKFCLIRGFPNLKEAFLVIAAEQQSQQQGREIALIDPRGNKEEIMGIMERVRESFRHEVPQEEFAPEGKIAEEDDEEEEHVDEWGRFEIDTGLELVPKAKVWGSQGHQHQHQHMGMGGMGGMGIGAVVYAS